MSVVVVPSTQSHDASYSYRSLGWKVYWSEMVAIDSKGRRWDIKEDNGELYLEIAGEVRTTIVEPSIRSQYDNYKMLRKFVGTIK